MLLFKQVCYGLTVARAITFFIICLNGSLQKAAQMGLLSLLRLKTQLWGNGSNIFKLLYGTDEGVDKAVSSVIKSAVSDSDVQVVTDFLWQECLNTKCAVYEFGITVPFNEYFNGIGVLEKKAR